MIAMDQEVEQRVRRRPIWRAPGPALPASPPSTARYPPERLALMKRVSALMFLAGALIAEIGVLITQRTEFSKRAQTVCAVVLAIVGLALLVTPARQKRILAAVVLSIVDVAVLIAIARPVGMGPLFLLWPLVFSAYFFSRRTLAVLFGIMVVGLTIGIRLNTDIELKSDTFIGVASCVGLMAGLVSVMTEREERLRNELERIASTDPLTELMNRRAFDPRLQAMFEDAVSTSSPLSIVMFDLDHFKQFNDRYGHLVGDLALQRVADVLRQQSRDGDAVSRFGGEEFVVALRECDVSAARGYSRRVAAGLAASDDDARLRLSISAGISAIELYDDALSILGRADAALYVAKQSGRARAAWFDGTRFAEQVFAELLP